MRKSDKKNLKCFGCANTGHFKRHCWQLHGKPGKKDLKKHEVNKATRGDTVNDEHCGPFVRQELALESKEASTKWIIDSGATCHMSNDRDDFLEIGRVQNTAKIQLGDGKVSKGNWTRSCEVRE